MASLSKVFKASQLSMMEEVKVISQPPVSIHNLLPSEGNEETLLDKEGNDGHHSGHLAEEAHERAQAIIEAAEQEARSLKSEAEEQISFWWEENQNKLEAMSIEAKEQGYKEGFLTGRKEAESEIQLEYQEKLQQIHLLIECAYEKKDAIISEAEPFLLELSTAIATQIIKQELDQKPDKLIELIKLHILRFKEKEFITVCVHPDDFEFIHAQRTHLAAVVNGETEIKVIPDHSVTPKGCIIRTAYGSVDARIDTQIEEIKKVILEVRREPESGINS